MEQIINSVFLISQLITQSTIYHINIDNDLISLEIKVLDKLKKILSNQHGECILEKQELLKTYF
jgi:hypothetical protein